MYMYQQQGNVQKARYMYQRRGQTHEKPELHGQQF